MKIEPGAEFLVEGVSFTIVKKSIANMWLICETNNPIAQMIIRDEDWIKHYADKKRNEVQ